MDKTKNSHAGLIAHSLRGAIIALCWAMALILVFAFIVKWLSLTDGVINPINQIIKVVSIFFGVLGACKVGTEKFFSKGLIVGAFFSIIAFVIFSMLNNFTFSFTPSIIWDLLFSALVGGICSVIVYYIKK